MTAPNLTGLGNSKLGSAIFTFSLPAVATCPGRTAACSAVCYATRGHFRRPSVQEKFAANLKATRRKNFVERMVMELDILRAKKVRIHVSGDFYSQRYIRKWRQIVRRLPWVRFYAYTRSWRVPRLVNELEALASLPTVSIWLSADAQTGMPPKKWSWQAGTCYLAADDADLVEDDRIDLFFRERPTTERKFVGRAMVCPNEQGLEKSKAISCSSCNFCLSKQQGRRFTAASQDVVRGPTAPSRRTALSLVG